MDVLHGRRRRRGRRLVGRSGGRRRRRHGPAPVHNDLPVDLVGGVAVLDALPGGDARYVGVDFEDAQAPHVPAVAGVAAEPDAAGVAHPQGGFLDLRRRLLVWVGLCVVPGDVLEGEEAVVVAVVAGDDVSWGWRGDGRRVRKTYCPALTMRTPCSTRASRNPELYTGAVTPSFHSPTRGSSGLAYSVSGMWMKAMSMWVWLYSE